MRRSVRNGGGAGRDAEAPDTPPGVSAKQELS